MTKTKRKRSEGKSAIEIAEEAVHLLRRAPARALIYYYFGSLPFILGLLYFWADMSESAFAYSQLYREVSLLVVLFIWMKTMQAMYARLLWAEVSGEPVPRMGARRLMKTAILQTVLQPSGLFFLPIAALITVPFGYTYAFYQNVTVLDDGGSMGAGELAQKAMHLARPWQKQNHLLIWALSPFLTIVAAGLFLVIMPIASSIGPQWTGLFLGIYATIFVIVLMPLSPLGVIVAANIAFAIFMSPRLLHMLLGINTVFLENSRAMLNSTFFAVVVGLTYLCMDPLMKAAYVLRCFYVQSIRSGEDLKVELRRLALKAALPAVLCIFCLGAFTPDASAAPEKPSSAAIEQPESVSPRELDAALDRELTSRRYAWRMPREEPEEAMKKQGPIGRFMQGIASTIIDWGRTIRRWLDKLFDWLDSLFPEPARNNKAPNYSGIGTVLRVVLYVLLAAILVVTAVMIFQMWKRRDIEAFEVEAERADTTIDIEDENVAADGLPEAGWLKMAQDLLEKGELRLAVRAMFLATLSYLGEREFVNIARFKSNLDYRRELGLRAHARPEILETFSHSVTIYEAVWYGLHEARRELFDRIAANQERLRERESEQ